MSDNHPAAREVPVPRESRRPFYGWFVPCGFRHYLRRLGCTYSFSAFIDSLQRDFGASRGSVSLVFALGRVPLFQRRHVSGPLADRFGSRRSALFGMILIGTGLALASVAQNILQVYAAYGLGIGLGVGCSYVPAVGAVPRWFARRRGFASGIASSGIGFGTLIVPPLASLLITHVGWRETYLTLSAGAVISGASMALLIENDPRDRGLGLDGDPPQNASLLLRAPGGSIKEALRSRQFIGLYAACLSWAFGVFVPFVHLVPYAIDRGIAPASAALLLSAIGIGSALGRFFSAGSDLLGRELSLIVMFVGMALALFAWAMSTGFWSLAGFALVFGTAYGGWVALLPAVVMDYFGGRNVSGLIGILYTR
jgi:MFS family permease